MAREYVELRNGTLYVKETRVSLDSIVYSFREGDSPETIRENFEVLTLEQVYGAITHYLANQVEIDEYLRGREQTWAELEKNARPADPTLAQRIEKHRTLLQMKRG
jgi:uncharacterized protein (DUF433 family)